MLLNRISSNHSLPFAFVQVPFVGMVAVVVSFGARRRPRPVDEDGPTMVPSKVARPVPASEVEARPHEVVGLERRRVALGAISGGRDDVAVVTSEALVASLPLRADVPVGHVA